jgi:hypothetical protein
MAFGKAWRKNAGKKVVLLSCHYDIVDWLQPDWVFDTATGESKKKTALGKGRSSTWKLGRSTPLTGDILSGITI